MLFVAVAVSSVFLTQEASTACRVGWTGGSCLCPAELLPDAGTVLSALGLMDEETALNHHLTQSIACCLGWGIMAVSNSFHLLPQIFLLGSDRRSKELEGPTRGGLVLPNAVRQEQLHIAGAWPLFHSAYTWKAFINMWSKLIFLPIISGPSKTRGGNFSSSSSKLPFICQKLVNPCVSDSLVQLNRLPTSCRSYFPTLICISLLSDLSTCFLKCTVQNQSKSSSLGHSRADKSTSHVLHIMFHFPNARKRFTFFLRMPRCVRLVSPSAAL